MSLRRLAIATTCLLALAGCSGGSDDDDDGATPDPPRLTVRFVYPEAPDPFDDLSRFQVSLKRASDDGVVVTQSFDDDETLSIPGVEPIANVYLVLEGFDDDDDLVSRGRTLAFDLVEDDAEVSMYFSRVHEFSDVLGDYEPRAAPSVVMFSDGRVLIAGGIASGDPSARAELYDWRTNEVVATASLGTALAFPGVALVAPDVVLLAGGADADGDASRAAQVYAYTPAIGTGAWVAGVPLMSEAHADMGAASLGGGQALIAGGLDASGDPNDVTEIFTWTGTGNGSWANGPVMAEDRLGPVTIAAGGGSAIVGGGFRENPGETAIEAYRDCTSFDGAFSAEPPFDDERAWSGVLPLGGGQWLLFGGLEDVLPGTPVATTELLTWDGSSVTHTAGPDLPSAQRRGGAGALATGELLVIGGDTSGWNEALAPVDSVLVYDPAGGGSFTPFGATPGATTTAVLVPLPDLTTLVVVDGRVTRYNPLP